jgi:hypothetical protein
MELPWFTSWPALLLLALLAAGFYHVVLLRIAPANQVFWKRVDYLWLSMALLGAIATVAANRQATARTMLLSDTKDVWAADLVRTYGQAALTQPICIDALRGAGAPDNYSYCSWIQDSIEALRQFDRSVLPLLAFRPAPRPRGSTEATWKFQSFESVVSHYRDIRQARAPLLEATRLTPLEDFFRLVGPAVVVVALALRVTKTTAEVRQELAKVGTAAEQRRHVPFHERLNSRFAKCVPVRPNPSLEQTRSGRRRLAAPGNRGHCPSAASRRPPPRAAQLKR